MRSTRKFWRIPSERLGWPNRIQRKIFQSFSGRSARGGRPVQPIFTAGPSPFLSDRSVAQLSVSQETRVFFIDARSVCPQALPRATKYGISIVSITYMSPNILVSRLARLPQTALPSSIAMQAIWLSRPRVTRISRERLILLLFRLTILTDERSYYIMRQRELISDQFTTRKPLRF